MNNFSLDYSLKDIDEVAQKCVAHAQFKTMLFYGEMGVGKTTLIKELVKLLGSTDEVSSPTFSIVNEYQTGKNSIFHFDFYRINDEEEVYDIGFEDYFRNPADWQLMEWPELIPNLLPEQFTKIEIRLNSTEKRTLKLTNYG